MKSKPASKRPEMVNLTGCAGLRQIIGAARVRKVHGINPTVDDVKKAFRKAQAEKDKGKPVVNLSDYRLKTGSDLVAQLKR